MNERVHTSERDVTADLLAALEMYDGLCGSESTTITSIAEGQRNSIVLVLSNGDEYALQVRLVREADA